MTKRGYNSEFANGFKNEVGRLDTDPPRRSKGKKVFEWQFKAAGAPKPIPVDVYLTECAEGMQFKATSERLPYPVTDTDINRLRQQVESALLEQASALSGITWEDWFEVVVEGDNSDFTDSYYSAWGSRLHIQVNRMKRGSHPGTGKPMTINHNGIVVEFPQATSIREKPKTEDFAGDVWLSEIPKERAYIPATAENKDALDEILKRMAMLRANLSSLLAHDTISESLLDLNKHLPPLLTDQSK